MIRYLKIVLVAFVGLQALLYALHNVINSAEGFGAVASVLGQGDHTVYPASIVPAITSPALIWLAFATIIAGETLVGVLAAKGAVDMAMAVRAPAPQFDAAKRYALLGCAMGLVVWFGFFGAFGGALFQMWQTQVGAGSLADAFKFSAWSGLVFLIVNASDG